MIEVEIKALIDDCRLITEKLYKLDFHKKNAVLETDIYFNGNDRDFSTTDEALRLRSSENIENGNNKNYITYKGRKLDDISQTRREYEVSIEKADVMYDIFTLLGYKKVINIKKTREYYYKNEITACVDKVDGLGSFIELEIILNSESSHEECVKILLSLLSDLGVPETALTRKSYLELLLEKGSSKKSSI